MICISISSFALRNRFISHNPNPIEISSIAANPELVGQENLCIVFGSVIGTYSGGGDPGDVYSWLVTGPNGEKIFNRSGGDQFETINVLLNEIGIHTVSLAVRRGTLNIYNSSLQVNVLKGPTLNLLPDYLLCGDAPVRLTAIDPATPNLPSYTFIWKNRAGNVVGNTNELTASTEGFYTVQLFLTNSDNGQDCPITGTAYVGPPLDFQIRQSADRICEGSSIQFGTNTPLSKEWFIRKSGTSQTTSLGTAFNISIASSTLPGIGNYEVIFSAFDPNLPNCRSERKATFELQEALKIQINLIEKPDNCTSSNGNFNIQIGTALDSLVVSELGFVIRNVLPGQTLNFDNLRPRIYTIKFFANGCELTNLFILDAKDPPIQVETSFEYIPESCSTTGILPGKLKIKFPQGPIIGEYRILGQGSGGVLSGNIQNQDSLVVDLAGGSYFLRLTIDGCTYPIKEFTIDRKPKVEFNAPTLFNICETFDFVPETNQDLLFTLTYPDGSSRTLDAQNPFQLTDAGNYSLAGISKDTATGLCPKVQSFTVTLSQTIVFEPVLKEEDCFGNKIYEAQIAAIDPDQTSIRWLNDQGEIVGRSAIFFPTSLGEFSLLVQPLGSGFCPVFPIVFENTAANITVPMELATNKICPEPGFSTIVLTTNATEVTMTEWIFFDLNENRRDLTEFDGLFEISVSEEGTYEAVTFNRLGCEVGRTLILVENSTILTTPNLEDRYSVCSKENTLPPLDPGEFAAYEWYFEEDLASDQRLFKPSEVGEYTLIATTIDGCAFIASFTTFDACDLKIVYPNAIILDDPARDFRVLVSEGVMEADLYIFNRQGALIHFEQTNEISPAIPILVWDGKFAGTRKSIPSGTYVVVLILRNFIYGFEERITSSLLVID